MTNFPSPSLAISQKNSASVTPTETRNPLLASRVTGVYGIKKNKDKKQVASKVVNDNLLKKDTFFDSIVF